MKKSILALAPLLFAAIFAHAQWATTGSATTTTNWVGIGTNSAPQRTLQVFGTGIRVNATSSTTSFLDLQDASTSQGIISKTAATGLSTIDINPITADGVSNAYVRLFRNTNSTGNSLFQIFSGDGSSSVNTSLGGDAATSYINALTGNLGIGTTDTHNFKLAVNGSVIATSVTVQLNSAWPDYVFKNSYLLPSLTDVKTYIDQNHHLPEIPSEQEVAQNGINLGEMNKLLLKKVEELTLYLIEKDKEVKEDREELKQLKAQVAQLIKADPKK